LTKNYYIEKNTALVEACKKGDSKAQYEIYKLYSKAMYNVCFRILGNEPESEDALQEAFVDAFMKINSFKNESAFGAWLKQIVINKALNLLRSRKNVFVNIEDHTSEIEQNKDYEIVDESEINYTVENISHNLNKLPEGYRLVLSLYLFEGYDHEEISQILNISESTSRSQYLRGKQKLMTMINA
jgi:RNA polymerase sigma factor (sigma-70 family)